MPRQGIQHTTPYISVFQFLSFIANTILAAATTIVQSGTAIDEQQHPATIIMNITNQFVFLFGAS